MLQAFLPPLLPPATTVTTAPTTTGDKAPTGGHFPASVTAAVVLLPLGAALRFLDVVDLARAAGVCREWAGA